MEVKDIAQYLETHLREYHTDEYLWYSYHAPHTMYHVSNDLDEVLLEHSYHAIKMWHRTMSRLKRNRDASKACTVTMKYKAYEDILSRNYYYLALKELVNSSLLLPTPVKQVYVVNLLYANKLYKPKPEV